MNISGKIWFNNDDLLESTLPGKLVTIFTLFDVVMIYVILGFVSWLYDDKVAIERRPAFLPKRPPRGFRLYALLLETGKSPAGGTTSQVFVRLCGKLTSSPAFLLTCTSEQRKQGSRRLFGSQNKDIFVIALPHYLGGIEAFEVVTDRRGECPPWFLRSIRAMCLDNRKCWKSNVGTWLRGDKKPYHIKADIIGALSTEDYVKKVVQQNHNWLSAWYRALGSPHTCIQRTALHWASMGVALGVSHYMLYDSASLGNIEKGEVTVPNFVTHEIVLASVLGSASGVILTSLLRYLARATAGCGSWPRVDDKDDFEHLIDNLVFAEGAVLRLPSAAFENCWGYLNLTPKQIKVIKHIVECGIGDCSLKNLLNNPRCPPTHDCCFSNLSGMVDSPWRVELLDAPEISGERGYAPSIRHEMKQLWHEDISTNRQYVPPSTMKKVSQRLSGIHSRSSTSSRHSKCGKRKRRGVTPSVSARMVSRSASSTSLEASQTDREESDDANHHYYDSLSEGQSDQELATHGAKTESEINLTRRSSTIYNSAPRWNAAHQVWVQHVHGGDDHHTALNERYDRTVGDPGPCCIRADTKYSPEGVILDYIDHEERVFSGGIRDESKMVSTFICGFGAFLATSTVAFVVYQRLPLSNADSLVYLYAVMLILVFEPLFSTVDASLWALVAMWARRNRILRARRKNAKMFRRLQI